MYGYVNTVQYKALHCAHLQAFANRSRVVSGRLSTKHLLQISKSTQCKNKVVVVSASYTPGIVHANCAIYFLYMYMKCKIQCRKQTS